MQRIYAPRSETVDRALGLVVDLGLSAPDDSRAEKISQVIAAGEATLSEQYDRLERARAYDEIALDEERSADIRESVLDAAEHGLI